MPVETLEQELKSKAANFNPERKEGPVAKAIESQTAKLPSDTFLWAAIGAMATSLTLKIMGKNHTALFIGQWAAPFLLLGVYNKIVKVEGHD
jgi:uroporphyrinogen-III decarboxylase